MTSDSTSIDIEDIKNRTHERIIELLKVPAERVTEHSSIVDDLDADSLDVVEIVMALEDEFDIEITDDQAEAAQTVGEIISLISEMLHAKEAA